MLGTRGRLPIEVVPFGAGFCRRRLAAEGYPPVVRTDGGTPVVSDNGNLILDCTVHRIADAAGLDEKLRAIPGVVGTGLFVGMAHTVLVWAEGRVPTLRPVPTTPGIALSFSSSPAASAM